LGHPLLLEAENNLNDFEKLFSDGTKMAFVTAGMGGGTGTGAAPVVAGVAKRMGILTVGVVTIPFYFEKKRKIIKALKGVEELRKNVDALLIINNERLCDVYADSDLSIKDAFKRADNILKDAVKGIAELITVHSDGSINLDFRDVETTMRNGGGAIMAMGRGTGEHRVERAILDALDSPLLYGNDIGKARRILFNIYASDEHPIFVREMQEIDDFFDQLDPNIDVIWGTSTDDTLGEDAKVTILATGLEDELRREVDKDVHQNEDALYEDLIPLLYKPSKIKKSLKAVREEPEAAGEEPDMDSVPFEVEVAQEPEAVAPQEQMEEDDGETLIAEDPKQELKGVTQEENVQKTDVQAEEKKVETQSTPNEKPHKKVEHKDQSVIVNKWKRWLNNLVKDIDE